MNTDPVKVLYIAGWGRSGSTILTNVLGQVDGFFAAGELRYLWQRNLLDGHNCGCGEGFADCRIWSGVVGRAGIGVDDATMHDRIAHAAGDQRIPAMILRGSGYPARLLGEGAERLVSLYRGIRDELGCRVVVDSSKVPSYGFLLGGLPGIDLRVLHLVRDPRAVAYSWLRKKMQKDVGREMIRRSAFESGWRWAIRNAEVDMLWRGDSPRVVRMRYESFIDRPEHCLRTILSLMGEEDAALPIVRPGVVLLGSTHTSSGNPNRFQTGETELRRDDEWRRKMRARDRRVVTSLTWPQLLGYGFGKDDDREAA